MKLILWVFLPCLIIGAAGCETNHNGTMTQSSRHAPPAYWDNNAIGTSSAEKYSEPLSPVDRLYYAN